MAHTLVDRARAFITANPDLADVIDFTPVPRRRARGDGGSDTKQVWFLRVLLTTGVPGLAAHAVGMSRQSAYRLRSAPGATSFRAAWDVAADIGQAMALEAAMDARNPVTVPRFYRGQAVGTCTMYASSLVFAALRSLDAMARRTPGEAAKVTR